MGRIPYLALVLLLVAATGCAPARRLTFGRAAPPVPREVPVAVEKAPAAPGALPSFTERMIVQRAELELTVRDTQESLSQIEAMAAEVGGYTVESRSWREEERLYASLTIRVPAERFEEAISRLRSLAVEVRSESTSGEDVTEEYTDLESRLRNLEAAERQLLKIMEGAEETEDVLAVYKELVEIRGKIEQTKGRMRYLERMSAMATIRIELAPEVAVVEPGWHPLCTLRGALRALVIGSRLIANAIIWIVVLSPLLAIPVVLGWLGWRRWKATRSQ